MKRLAAILHLCVATAVMATTVEYAGIVAVVNGAIITAKDLEERVKLVIFSSGGQIDSSMRKQMEQQILAEMINEQLRWQCAKKFESFANGGRWVSNEMLNGAFADIAQQNNMSTTAFEQLLQKNNIDKKLILNQIRYNLSWMEYIKARFAKSVNISRSDLKRRLLELKEARHSASYQVQRMFFPVVDNSREREVSARVQHISAMLAKGAVFENVARQFSEGIMASRGGNIGWIRQGQLAADEYAVLSQMKIGEYRTIRNSSGYVILKLVDKRDAGCNNITSVQFVQVAVPTNAGHSMEELQGFLNYLRNNYSTIESLLERARAAGCYVSEPVNAVQDTLPQPIRTVISSLSAGSTSSIQKTPDALFLICVLNKKVQKIPEPTEEEISEQQFGERMAVLADKELQEARRKAEITINEKYK